jgi:class 3 adenylate cyclase/predicted alpha/beta hydrolase
MPTLAPTAGRVLGPPEGATTRYVRCGDRSIAYQVVGSGPVDLVVIPGFVSHIELHWESPSFRALLEGLTAVARVVVFDKPGTGMSDAVTSDRPPTMAERLDDVLAVFDAAGVRSAAVLGLSEGGPLAVALAHARPDRVSHLVLYGTYASLETHPHRANIPKFVDLVASEWGRGSAFSHLAPSLAESPGGRDLLARFERFGATPRNAGRLLAAALDVDVRPLLAHVHVPTLVVVRDDDAFMPVSMSAAIVDAMPNATLRTVAGRDHWLGAGAVDEIVRSVQRFVTDDPDGTPVDGSTELTTMLFVDVVGSTEAAARLGDRRWLAELARFHDTNDVLIERWGGRRVTTSGDGLLACIDKPSRAVRCAMEMRHAARRLGLEVRIGVHTAEVERHGHDVAGIGVHVAARVQSCASPGEVLVTRTVRDLVAGASLQLEPSGSHVLRGLDEAWELYRVVSA